MNELVLHISYIGPRFKCGRIIKKLAKDDDYGPITKVKLKRISFLHWYLYFDIEVKKK